MSERTRPTWTVLDGPVAGCCPACGGDLERIGRRYKLGITVVSEFGLRCVTCGHTNSP